MGGHPVRRTIATAIFPLILLGVPTVQAQADDMPWIAVSKDTKGFALEPSGKPFTPWGFNYDHDSQGRLLEDYCRQATGGGRRLVLLVVRAEAGEKVGGPGSSLTRSGVTGVPRWCCSLITA
jgi:hypothetical protein